MDANVIENEQLVQDSLILAKDLQKRALKKSGNSTFSKRLKPLLKHPDAKVFLIQMLDVAFRSETYTVVAKFVKRLFDSSHAHMVLFSSMEQKLIKIFQKVGYLFPMISIPFMRSKIADVAKDVVFVHDSQTFAKHIHARGKEGIQLNINLIGEALMGENEAAERIEKYRHLLNDPMVDYISVKISTIYSQIESIAYHETLAVLNKRLAILYQELVDVNRATGKWKFINLDMEEYRDMSLTVDAFMATLSLPQFHKLRAGIVLQAYIPDSFKYLMKLQSWAKLRVSSGGAPIKIRVVKGANMEMEKTEASIQGWPLVTFDQKVDSDANYKKMLMTLLTPESCKNIHVGIASHNVFDLSFALCIVKKYKIEAAVDFEMLEGMAINLANEILSEGVNVLLYTPLVEKRNFMSAVAYLVRRLDEGTADGNFMKEGFELDPDSKKWTELEIDFIESLRKIEYISDQPKRSQNRNSESYDKQIGHFRNEADTDWALEQNRIWLEQIFKHWKSCQTICGESVIRVSGTLKSRKHTSQNNWQGKMPWTYELADSEDYNEALLQAKASIWYSYTHVERIDILRQVAIQLQKCRADLIGVGIAEVGKLVKELDSEISEAIDFANYYAYSMESLLTDAHVEYKGGGVNLVLSPWNFPIAIPAGGILASLAAGNTVIIKPSLNAAGCCYVLCKCLWDAGIPKDALFFLPAEEVALDPFLSNGNVFSAVILTGGTDTAKMLLDRNPHLNLFAETGGKNATIVTALADKEQAVKHIIHSAFSNTGQKCSATSLLILEKEVFDDDNFKNLFKDALLSKKVGSPWDLDTQIGPLSVSCSSKLTSVVKSADSTRWLIKPEINGHHVTPGILWGVSKNDPIFSEELFGPILAVVPAADLHEAIALANSVPYGLTSGLESLDEEEISLWKDSIQAGNLYINRSTTGAIVQRQPFGGIKSSCFGFGMKAGGPNYITQFLTATLKDIPNNIVYDARILVFNKYLNSKEMAELAYAYNDYKMHFNNHFSKEIDYSSVRGQHNLNRYVKPAKVVLTVDKTVSVRNIALVVLACEVIGVDVEAVCLVDDEDFFKNFGLNVVSIKSWEEIAIYMQYGTVLRTLNKQRIPESILKIAHDKAIHLFDNEPIVLGRFELLNYLSEQSISYNFHRYGNLMGRE